MKPKTMYEIANVDVVSGTIEDWTETYNTKEEAEKALNNWPTSDINPNDNGRFVIYEHKPIAMLEVSLQKKIVKLK